MKYCPRCRTEYLDHAESCADCSVPLVDEEALARQDSSLGDEDEAEPGVILCGVNGPVEAEQVLSLLGEEGIEGRLHSNVETVHIGFAEDHAGWGEIWVPRSAAYRASQLLAAYRQSAPEDSTEGH